MLGAERVLGEKRSWDSRPQELRTSEASGTFGGSAGAHHLRAHNMEQTLRTLMREGTCDPLGDSFPYSLHLPNFPISSQEEKPVQRY